MRLLAMTLLALCLSGCAVWRTDQKPVQNTVQGRPPILAPLPTESGTLGRPDLSNAVAEIQASNNAAQQSMQALLGLEIGKVAEKVDASLLRIQSTLEARIETTLAAQANLHASARAELTAHLAAQFRAEVQASATAQAEAHLQAVATLRAEFQALAGGQAGAFNRLEQMQQDIQAGRDAITTTVQFTREHVDVLQGAQETNRWTTYIAASLILALQELSRRRAEARFRETFTLVKHFTPALPAKEQPNA